jgi:hypothetical protein
MPVATPGGRTSVREDLAGENSRNGTIGRRRRIPLFFESDRFCWGIKLFVLYQFKTDRSGRSWGGGKRERFHHGGHRVHRERA